MTVLVVLTLTAAGLIVVALALALITILLRLRAILFTLGTINVGLRAIAGRVEPIEPLLAEINLDLTNASSGLRTTLRQ